MQSLEMTMYQINQTRLIYYDVKAIFGPIWLIGLVAQMFVLNIEKGLKKIYLQIFL